MTPANAAMRPAPNGRDGQGRDTVLAAGTSATAAAVISPMIVVPGLDEPLVATRAVSADEERAIGRAIDEFRRFHAEPQADDLAFIAPFERFVADQPHSTRMQPDQAFIGESGALEVGLNANVGKRFDPVAARWKALDAMPIDGQLNPYAYGEGDPVNASDPLGLIDPHDSR